MTRHALKLHVLSKAFPVHNLSLPVWSLQGNSVPSEATLDFPATVPGDCEKMQKSDSTWSGRQVGKEAITKWDGILPAS